MARTCPARVRDRGQVTIDANVRRELGLESGDFVKLTVEPLEEDSG